MSAPLQRRLPRKTGQVLLFLLMALVILFFVVVWNFDLHKIVFIKTISRNGGDAAALVAARWQGVTLNLIGDLNLLHAVALGTDAADETEQAILGTQARLCFVGPMIAFMASQQAAKNNGIFQNDRFSDWLRKHAHEVRDDYTRRTDPGAPMLFPEPYPDAWKEYAAMLELIASDGVAAGPDNARYFSDYSGDHYLLMQGFYDAIASRDWCWFYRHAPHLLENYRNFFPCWWDPLPRIEHAEYINSEIFGLGLSKESAELTDLADWSAVADVAADRDISIGYGGGALDKPATWYCYNGGAWQDWKAMALTGDDPFPGTGEVRPQYDYTGADSVVRVEATATRLTPGAGGSKVTKKITWTAAAKPFGYLNHDDRPDHYSLVLPAFHEARLIPIDASSGAGGGSYDLDWRKHIEQHLPNYMNRGLGGLDGACWYCSQLRTWEDASFRQEGVNWLRKNSGRCKETGGFGGGGGGGSRHGH